MPYGNELSNITNLIKQRSKAQHSCACELCMHNGLKFLAFPFWGYSVNFCLCLSLPQNGVVLELSFTESQLAKPCALAGLLTKEVIASTTAKVNLMLFCT